MSIITSDDAAADNSIMAADVATSVWWHFHSRVSGKTSRVKGRIYNKCALDSCSHVHENAVIVLSTIYTTGNEI